MNRRTTLTGEFTLPLSPASALTLFTPEGERRWAGHEWDPTYPVGGASADDSAPGTVFTTTSEDGDAIWVVVDRFDDGLLYARVSPGRIAGTVSVTCSPGQGPDDCLIRVCYDLSSLEAGGIEFVHGLATGYKEFLDEWREEILAALARENDSTKKTLKTASGWLPPW